jgi:hypothetical protein
MLTVRVQLLIIPVSAVMLNLTGIIFAIQFVTLLFIGAYADYGKWRPWVMIGEWFALHRYQQLINRFHWSSLLLSILYFGSQQARSMGWCSSMLRGRSVW